MRLSIGRKWLITGCLLIAALVVVGLVLLERAVDNIFDQITMSDCRWTATAFVWNDDDKDGIPGEDENPIPNVPVHVDDVQNNRVKVTSGMSDAQGNAKMDLFVAGCPETDFQVYVEPLEDYCLTTPERISQHPFNFGFVLCTQIDG